MNVISSDAMAAEISAADQWLKLYQSKLADKPEPTQNAADAYLLNLALYSMGVLAALRWIVSSASRPPSQQFLELVINGEAPFGPKHGPGGDSTAAERLQHLDGKEYLRLARELGEQRMGSALEHVMRASNELALAAADLSTILGATNVRRRACELSEQPRFFFNTVATLADRLRSKAGVQVDRDTVQAELARRRHGEARNPAVATERAPSGSGGDASHE